MALMKKVMVLMATYNGQKYIKEQLDSILNQVGVEVHCTIRDDASQDDTLSILDRYCKNNSNITIIKGSNLGASKCFHDLAKMVKKKGYDYFAFSDQDDVWEEKKLVAAVEKLETLPSGIPRLYISNLKVVDKDLNFLFNLHKPGDVSISKGQSLASIPAYGCTCVFDIKALELFTRTEMRDSTVHDAWMYLLCVFMGNVIYDENAYIKYRQHGTNASGIRKKGLMLWIERFGKLLKLYRNGNTFGYITNDILTGYQDILTNEDIRLLEIVALYKQSLRNRLRFFISKEIRAKSFGKNLCIRVRIILGKV